MSILVGNPFFLDAGAGATGYQISRSLRFNSSDSAYLSRTPASAGNRKTWTWAGWVKRSGLDSGTQYTLFGNNGNSNETFGLIAFFGNNIIVGGFLINYLVTSAVYRDPGAWMHIVVAMDTTQATASNRLKLYVNGSEVTAFSTDNRSSISQNSDQGINQAVSHAIGRQDTGSGSGYFSGFIADVFFIDGQQLDPSSFTEVSATTGQLIPKAYTGTFGTNGFWLKFSDNSAATATTLGKDYSGNNNNWSPSNLSVTAGAGNDSLTDTPTSYGTDTGAGGEVRGNYCTWGATYAGAAGLSNGNLDYLGPTTMNAFGSFLLTSGKWYWEILNSGTGLSYVGIIDSTIVNATDTTWSTQARSYQSSGSKYDGLGSTSYGASYAAGDVIGFALDLDANTLTFYKNGVSQGVAFSSGLIGKEWKPAVYGSGGAGCSANFGQRSWAYAAPAGFKALCDANLPAPTIALPNTVMDVKLYTGNGSTQTISGLGFSPDLVWIKRRSAAADHMLQDQIRGATAWLSSNRVEAENTNTSSDWFRAFTSDGFTVAFQTTGGLSTNEWNASGSTYVAWNWDAGSSTVTNTAGSITSQVRANASAGFSIIGWTGASSGTATIGHGLGAAPAMIITRPRNGISNWVVYHRSVGNDAFLRLNTTDASVSSSACFGTGPTSTVFTLNQGLFGIAGDCIGYAFAPVAGYSSFGSYIGNGSADGPFQWCGFRPRFVLLKGSSFASNWHILDAARNTFNVTDSFLRPNLSSQEFNGIAENSGSAIDILSNGFKIRANFADSNTNTATFVWAAFAESPFQYARAR